jgi:hypothetical protein
MELMLFWNSLALCDKHGLIGYFSSTQFKIQSGEYLSNNIEQYSLHALDFTVLSAVGNGPPFSSTA